MKTLDLLSALHWPAQYALHKGRMVFANTSDPLRQSEGCVLIGRDALTVVFNTDGHCVVRAQWIISDDECVLRNVELSQHANDVNEHRVVELFQDLVNAAGLRKTVDVYAVR